MLIYWDRSGRTGNYVALPLVVSQYVHSLSMYPLNLNFGKTWSVRG